MELPKNIAYRMVSDYLATLNEKEQDEFIAMAKDYFAFKDWPDLEERCGKYKGAELGSKIEARHSLEYMRLFHYCFGVPFAGYGYIDKDAFFSKYKGRIQQSSIVESEYIGGWTDLQEQNIDYATKYNSIVEKYINQARERIWVYEYLGKGRTKLPGLKLAHYSEAHKHLFARYESQMSQYPDLEYCRLLVLPISDNEEETLQTKFQDAVTKCSAQLFAHICNCFKSYKTNSRFFVVMIPPRIYHYVLFDKKFIFTELYKYNRDGDFLPDLLFVERILDEGEKHTRMVLNIYEKEFEKIINGSARGRQLSKEALIDATAQAYSISHAMQDQELDGLKQDILKQKVQVLREKVKILKEVFPDEIGKYILP